MSLHCCIVYFIHNLVKEKAKYYTVYKYCNYLFAFSTNYINQHYVLYATLLLKQLFWVFMNSHVLKYLLHLPKSNWCRCTVVY